MSADLWGEETGTSYNDYNGAEVSADGGGATMAQQQQTKTTADYLRAAYGDLVEAEDVGNENLAELGAQREILGNIAGNVDRIHRTLDDTDRRITQMENPWALGPVHTKSSGAKGYVPTTVGSAAHTLNHGAAFNMKGECLKQSQFWKKWNPRYLKQDGDVIHYYMKKGDPKPRGCMKLKGAILSEVHYDEAGRDNCFSLKDAVTNVVTLIAVETNSDYNTWVSCIRREIAGRDAAAASAPALPAASGAADPSAAYAAGGGPQRTYAKFGDEVENELLDGVMDKLDKLDGIGRNMRDELEDQTRIITDLNSRVGAADDRLINNSNRVRNIT